MSTTITTCKVKNCAFHHPDDLCAADEIKVESSSHAVVCDTFYPRDTNGPTVSAKDIPAGAELHDLIMADYDLGVNGAGCSDIDQSGAGRLTPLVACGAYDCQYWEYDICKAEKITIDGPAAAVSGDTRCQTYDPE